MASNMGRVAGWAGVGAGIALVAETASFLASGWTAEKMSDPRAAMDLLMHGGGWLRFSAIFGSSGIALTALLLAGLYFRLRMTSPRLSLAMLFWGMIGLASHVLIPLGLWLAIPGFVAWGGHDAAAAGNAWMAFWNVCNAAQGVGSTFGGAAMLVAGIAILRGTKTARPFAILAVLAGVLALVTVVVVGTPLQGLLGAIYLPMIALTIAFRAWGGIYLLGGERDALAARDRVPA
jgi:hypothetical protein